MKFSQLKPFLQHLYVPHYCPKCCLFRQSSFSKQQIQINIRFKTRKSKNTVQSAVMTLQLKTLKLLTKLTKQPLGYRPHRWWAKN